MDSNDPKLARVSLPKNELKNIRSHFVKAQRSFKSLRTKLMALGVALRKQLQGKDNKSLLRAARKQVSTFKPALAFLQRYHGTPDMDPSVKGTYKRTINLMAQLALGQIEEPEFWKKMQGPLGKSYEIIELASAQEGLRETVPAGIRQFLPSNLIVEVDETGKISGVTDRFVNELETMKVKRERQKDLLLRYNEIVEAVRKDMQSSNPRIKLAAIITSIVMETGIRPGQERNQTTVKIGDEEVAVQTFGATTLKAEHVKFVEDNFAHLEFVGKAGTTNKADIKDPTTIKALRQFIAQVKKDKGEGGGESPYLFVTKGGKRFNYGMLNRYFKDQTALKGLKITDFRKLKATQTVLANLHAAQEDLYTKIRGFVSAEVENLRERVITEVQQVVETAFLKAQVALSHEDVATTVKNYVNPEVLLRYLSRGGAARRLESVILAGNDKLVLDVDKFIANATGGEIMGKKAGKRAFGEGTLGGLLEEIEHDLEGMRHVDEKDEDDEDTRILRGKLVRLAHAHPEHRNVLLPLITKRAGKRMFLWKYNPVTGYWNQERDVTEETKDQWLARFQKDEPDADFQISARKPKGKPKS